MVLRSIGEWAAWRSGGPSRYQLLGWEARLFFLSLQLVPRVLVSFVKGVLQYNSS